MYFCFFSECIQKRNFLYIFLFIYLHSISCSIISQKSIFRLVTGTTDTFLIIAPSAGCSSHPNCIAICIQFSIGIFAKRMIIVSMRKSHINTASIFKNMYKIIMLCRNYIRMIQYCNKFSILNCLNRRRFTIP